MHRRRFLQQSTLGASALAMAPFPSPPETQPVASEGNQPMQALQPLPDRELDLSPARWIWYPSQRVLQNTVVLFRRSVSIKRPPDSALGWILGDSRYRLWVDGKRIQWGPAPSDPRFSEADPMDLTALLPVGEHVIGVEVLYFGQGDGTWPIGKAGLLFRLDLTYEDGTTEQIVSDASWQTHLARSWKPGQYKRWYLRAFQEEFDARRYPYGWTEPDFTPDEHWLDALVTGSLANRPAICTDLSDYLFDSDGDESASQLRRRQVPMLDEALVTGARLEESLSVIWRRPPEEYFESLTPDAYAIDRRSVVEETAPGRWSTNLAEGQAIALTFSFPEQVVGWPLFSITAPEGTIVEMMPHEAHRVGGPGLLNSRFHSWTRFICRAGKNTLEPFDFESLRWLQLHIRNAHGPVHVESVGVRRRVYPWPNAARLSVDDEPLRRLWAAGINTLHNCAQDTIVDCMGRERQQYSGDIGHVLHATMFAFGAFQQAGRYVDTYSQGLMNAGYYLDSWPAYDRLARLPERELQLSRWGPLLDHGVGHVFDCYHYWMATGDAHQLREAFARHRRFFAYLQSIRQRDGLLPVEDLGTPWVWIDHDAYRRQRHKQCAFNLYVAGMTREALAPLARAFGADGLADEVHAFGTGLLDATQKHFWSRSDRTFIVNLPWISDEGGAPRTCDRSLAMAELYDLFFDDDRAASVEILASAPPEMGFSYPANAGWRLRALAKAGRIDVVLDELRSRWATMRSVLENNTLSEHWDPGYDDTSQWSHAPVAPVYLLFQGVAGIRPLEPGFTRYEVRPQLGDLNSFALDAHTVHGPIRFAVRGQRGERVLRLVTPPVGRGELVLDSAERVDLEALPAGGDGHARYALPVDGQIEVLLSRS